MIPGIFSVCRHDPRGVLDFIGAFQPSVVKAFNHVTDSGWWLEAMRRSPASIRILVPAWITDNPDLSRPEADADEVAKYCDTNPGVPRLAITKNEVLHCDDPAEKWKLAINYWCRYLERAHVNGLDSVVGELNTGHPYVSQLDEQDQWQALLAVDPLMSARDYWGLHEYWNLGGPDEWWPWTAGRHMRYRGTHKVIIDECGLDRAVGWPANTPLPAHRGWNTNLSPEEYLDQLVRYHALISDPRVAGTCLFLMDYESSEWWSFDCMPLRQLLLERKGEFSVDKPDSIVPARLPAPLRVPLRITQSYAEHQANNAKGGWGVDFSCPVGTPVYAVAKGSIHWAGEYGGYGQMVRMKHSWGFTRYAHLSRLDCAPDQWFHAGDQIGLSGNTGTSTGPHLHFELEPLAETTWPYRMDPMLVIFPEDGGVAPAISDTMQAHVLSLTPGYALYEAGRSRGYVMQSDEVTIPLGEVEFVAQVFRDPADPTYQYIAYAKKGDWGNIAWVTRRN